MGLRLSKEEREIYLQVKTSLRFAHFDFNRKQMKKFIRWCCQNCEALTPVSVRDVRTWEEVGRIVAEAVQSKKKDVQIACPGLFLTVLQAMKVSDANRCSIVSPDPLSSGVDPSYTDSRPNPHPSREFPSRRESAKSTTGRLAPASASEVQVLVSGSQTHSPRTGHPRSNTPSPSNPSLSFPSSPVGTPSQLRRSLNSKSVRGSNSMEDLSSRIDSQNQGTLRRAQSLKETKTMAPSKDGAGALPHCGNRHLDRERTPRVHFKIPADRGSWRRDSSESEEDSPPLRPVSKRNRKLRHVGSPFPSSASHSHFHLSTSSPPSGGRTSHHQSAPRGRRRRRTPSPDSSRGNFSHGKFP